MKKIFLTLRILRLKENIRIDADEVVVLQAIVEDIGYHCVVGG